MNKKEEPNKYKWIDRGAIAIAVIFFMAFAVKAIIEVPNQPTSIPTTTPAPVVATQAPPISIPTIAPTKEPKTYTVDAIAFRHGSLLGEYNKPYAIKPSGGMSVTMSIKVGDLVRKGESLGECIVLETISDSEILKAYLEQKASFELVTNEDERDGDLETFILRGAEYNYIVLKPKNGIGDSAYVSIGGLSEKNGGTVAVFEINKQTDKLEAN